MSVEAGVQSSLPEEAREKDKGSILVKWLTSTDHKVIGYMYLITSFAFFLVGGVMALLIRTQLATPDMEFITRDGYNELFTMHGTTMIFLFVVPVLAGFANYLVPLMIGAQDMAFPRLNAMSYWFFLAGGLVLMGSFFADGGAAEGGWYQYPPLSWQLPQVGQDLWMALWLLP
jgi:cytochrome c oxidase subunit 1